MTLPFSNRETGLKVIVMIDKDYPSVNEGRWAGIDRPYSIDEVISLRGSVMIEHTLARIGSERLFALLGSEKYVSALGAMTGVQAVQQVRAGLKAVYVSGWQVAADANGDIYPDIGLYPADRVPNLVKNINNALRRQDQIGFLEGKTGPRWFVPLVADGEAGFGGVLNVYELTKRLIDAGAAAVHFEDQLPSAKKCGHLGGKVLVPAREFIAKLHAARLAADVSGVPTLLVARTDAESARLLSNDIDPVDRSFIQGGRTVEGFYQYKGGLDAAIARAISYAPYADLLWFETSNPDLSQAKSFAESVHSVFPGKLLAYNLSPSFNWKAYLSDRGISMFQEDLADLGYRFQFVTLAGFHTLSHSMYDLADSFLMRGMSAYVDLQEKEFSLQDRGYTSGRHQHEVGAGYFDRISEIISQGLCSTKSMKGSTEEGF